MQSCVRCLMMFSWLVVAAACSNVSRSDPPSLLALEKVSQGKEFLALQDMGTAHCYYLSPAMESTVGSVAIANNENWVQQIHDLYCSDSSGRLVASGVEFVFPLIDLLLRIERNSGQSTKDHRVHLWSQWNGLLRDRVEFTYCIIKYGLPLEDYEHDIQRYWSQFVK